MKPVPLSLEWPGGGLGASLPRLKEREDCKVVPTAVGLGIDRVCNLDASRCFAGFVGWCYTVCSTLVLFSGMSGEL